MCRVNGTFDVYVIGTVVSGKVGALSLRGFSADGMMVEADVVDGSEAEPVIERIFGNDGVAYIHAHYARPGCYAARIDRA